MDAFQWAVSFFYDAGNDHDRALFWGRFPFALFGALAGWLTFLEARRTLGELAALLGVAATDTGAGTGASVAAQRSALRLHLRRNQPCEDHRASAAAARTASGCVLARRTGIPTRLKWRLLRCGRIVLSLYIVIVAMYLPTPRLWPSVGRISALAKREEMMGEDVEILVPERFRGRHADHPLAAGACFDAILAVSA